MKLFESLTGLIFKRLILLIVLSANFQLFAPPPTRSLLDIDINDLGVGDEDVQAGASAPALPNQIPTSDLNGDHYQILKLNCKATDLAIKKAYFEQAREWHPDKWQHRPDTEKEFANAMFKKIGEAYAVLSDPVKKKAYDKDHSSLSLELSSKEAYFDKNVDYTTAFNGSKDEINKKLYGAFLRACRANNLEWYQTDDYQLLFAIYQCSLSEKRETVLSFMRSMQSRLEGVFSDNGVSELKKCAQAGEYITYSQGDAKELERLEQDAVDVLFAPLRSEFGLDSDAPVPPLLDFYIRNCLLRPARKLVQNETYPKNMNKLLKAMYFDSELIKDAKFVSLSEEEKKRIFFGFFYSLDKRRMDYVEKFSLPDHTLPFAERKRRLEARKITLNDIFEKSKSNFLKVLPYNIASIFSLLSGCGFLIYAAFKGASDFYQMRIVNKTKRRIKRKVTPKMILKGVAPFALAGVAFLGLRWFVLYQKAHIKFEGGFDTIPD